MSLKNIKQASFLFLLVFFCLSALHHKAFSQTKDQLLSLMWQGFGGKQSWDEARYFMFSCSTDLHPIVSGEHSYIWDRVSGDCRFEGNNANQEKLIVLFNKKNQKGRAFVNGAEITGIDSAQKFVKTVSEAFSNDSFWLFFPESLTKTTALKISESALIGSTRYYVVDLNTSVSNIKAIKSKVFIDTNTGRIFQWQALSKDGSVLYNFLTSNFKDVGGGLTLATSFSDTQTGTAIHYPIVSALINVEPDKFIKP